MMEESVNKKEIEFKKFCEKTEEALNKHYGGDSKIKLQKVRKTNDVLLTGVTIMRENENISPTIYLEPYYEALINGMSFSEIMQHIVDVYEENRVQKDIDISFLENYDRVKRKICFKLINYRMNLELLKDVPHIKYLDLAIVFYCVVLNEQLGNGSILVHNEQLKNWNVELKELMTEAMVNMMKYYPPQMKDMMNIIEEIYRQNKDETLDFAGDMEEREALLKAPFQNIGDSDVKMYVLTNSSRLNGASAILYIDLLEEIGQYFKKDYFILPSSIHEVILIPWKEDISSDFLSEMVSEINTTELKKEEILSNHAYLYSIQKKKIISLPLIPE